MCAAGSEGDKRAACGSHFSGGAGEEEEESGVGKSRRGSDAHLELDCDCLEAGDRGNMEIIMAGIDSLNYATLKFRCHGEMLGSGSFDALF